MSVLRRVAVFLVVGALYPFHHDAQGAVSYSIPGSIYLQDFDSLPNTPENTSLGTTAGGFGWTDDNANRILVGPFTVTGLNWAPGTDLWLRWSDLQSPGVRDDGMALDDLSFIAVVPEPSTFALVGLGIAGLLLSRRSRKR